MSNRADAASPISESMGAMAISGILLYGGSLVLDKSPDLNGASFIAYIVIFSQILPAIKDITNATGQLQRGLVSGERILEVIDTETKIFSKEKAIVLNEFADEIEFKNVSFAYTEDKKVLDNISFKVKKGQVLALVGASGSGKSTIADLLMRFYDVNEGEILFDGKNIKDCDVLSLRRQMSVVTQEAVLFNDSIEKNVAFGAENFDRNEVISALKIANANDFVLETENGYETNIGDRGVKLSGGQRQRLSIARSVMRNPAVLILDEATSALDSESEKIVQDALYNLMQNRTSVVIAHRLSTVKNADVIIVLDKGKIVESGKHEELMLKENGYYQKLITLQQLHPQG
jgi:subfamily B ATP-binding cassette protein MsbA